MGVTLVHELACFQPGSSAVKGDSSYSTALAGE
jgi:hypothetical protein